MRVLMTATASWGELTKISMEGPAMRSRMKGWERNLPPTTISICLLRLRAVNACNSAHFSGVSVTCSRAPRRPSALRRSISRRCNPSPATGPLGANLLRHRRHELAIYDQPHAIVVDRGGAELLEFFQLFRAEQGTGAGRHAFINTLQKFQALVPRHLGGDVAKIQYRDGLKIRRQASIRE